MAEYAVFVRREGVIYVEADSADEAEMKALYSGNDDVSWNDWFDVDNAQLESK